MLFHWTGTEVVFSTFAGAHKINAFRARPQVAITIDRASTPPEVLLIRGRASVIEVDGIVHEYVLAQRRYAGDEQGDANVAGVDHPGTPDGPHRRAPDMGRRARLPVQASRREVVQSSSSGEGGPDNADIVSMWVTLDGFVAGPQDELDWLAPDDRMQEYEPALVRGAEALLLGRITHSDLMHALVLAGELDELELFVAPVAIGTGTPILPPGSAFRLDQVDAQVWPGALHARCRIWYPSEGRLP